ncbi:manganese ion homeostasis protein [Grosmannia clavigera kw1407]|uniref:Manganese ion homeostasis protein n=1 Tax=Grosmannia clavigera (strain kw1407 / UAMH 11150) TaxID=655863 RepID=F0XN43_GROCL|nr:manganese ion homeostasis protein [Grosmannia clavigera kw1407]EFX00965.1 manganese ion homeostasis protein [Grosmannia clavigera kw1407]
MTAPHNNGFTPRMQSTRTTTARHRSGLLSDGDDFGGLSANIARLLYRYVLRKAAETSRMAGSMIRSNGGHGRRQRPPLLVRLLQTAWWHMRRNLTRRRLFSVPHLLVGFWMLVLLWGERWIFHARVAHCDWGHWEKWPSGATPHRVIFVADPQITDAHSYPGRPWPLSALTVMLTDNYMRRSYRELQEQLRPDTLFFLGDLFDGGREWRPSRGEFGELAWSSRPESEKAWARVWQKKYAEDYWLGEYARFGDIFLDDWNVGGFRTRAGQRGRRLIASLPGNHDLGFGSEVQQSVRNRFESFFGEGNRVDVVGNHTFVSVDTVSLSADTSERASQPDMQPIYGPTQHFLDDVAWTKKKAVARELRHQHGLGEEVVFAHRVEDLDEAQFDVDGLRQALSSSSSVDGDAVADLPTILLTHVPLYRPPGTPCGPLREHWPPTKPSSADVDAEGKPQPVFPDDRNAISVTRGYQYQNVLSEADSIRLVRSVGNVVQAFSGDDHDYCTVVHDERQDHVPEITVKAFNMAMGVPTPGFLMLSLHNPVDAAGRPLTPAAATGSTMQTHLCLLPNQLGTFARYAGMVVVSLVLLAARAVLVPVLGWQPFALGPRDGRLSDGGGGDSISKSRSSSVLPLYSKAKVEDDEYGGKKSSSVAAAAAASNGSVDEPGNVSGNEKGGASGSSGFFAPQAAAATYSRGRAQVNGRSGYGYGGGGDSSLGGLAPPYQHPHRHKNRSGRPRRSSRASASPAYAPKIEIVRDEDDSYGDDSSYDSFANEGGDGRTAYLVGGGGGGSNRWKPAARRRRLLIAGRTALASLKRLVWSTLGLRGSGRGRWRQAGFGFMYRGLNGGNGDDDSSQRRRHGGLHAQDGQPRAGTLQVAGREFWTTTWRLTWMVVVFWAWLNHRG